MQAVALLDEYAPALHALHSVVPTTRYEPEKQLAQTEAPVPEYVPVSVQVKHAVYPSKEYVPAWHTEHPGMYVGPCIALNVPGGHGISSPFV